MNEETLDFLKKTINGVAKSLQIHSEREKFICDNPKSNCYGTPSMTLSFTRPVSIKDGVLSEAVWYKGFKLLTNKSFISFKELQTIFGCQCQSIRYSCYLNKVDRNIYQPTKNMKKLVERIESIKNNILKEF